MTEAVMKAIADKNADRIAMESMVCPDCCGDLHADYWTESAPFYDLKCFNCGFYAEDSSTGHKRAVYNRIPNCLNCGYEFQDKFPPRSGYCGQCDTWFGRLLQKLFESAGSLS